MEIKKHLKNYIKEITFLIIVVLLVFFLNSFVTAEEKLRGVNFEPQTTISFDINDSLLNVNNSDLLDGTDWDTNPNKQWWYNHTAISNAYCTSQGYITSTNPLWAYNYSFQSIMNDLNTNQFPVHSKDVSGRNFYSGTTWCGDEIGLKQGWNAIAITSNTTNKQFRNITVNVAEGINVLGYSAWVNYKINQIYFDYGTGKCYLKDCPSGIINISLALEDDTLDTEGIKVSTLHPNDAFIVQSAYTGNITFINIVGSDVGETYAWSDLMFENAETGEVKNITDAGPSGSNWVQPTLYYWDNESGDWGLVQSINLPGGGIKNNVNSWEGTYVYSNNENISLLRQDYPSNPNATCLGKYYGDEVLVKTVHFGDGTSMTTASSGSGTYNETYANLISKSCPSGQVVNGTNSTGGLICTTVSSTGGSFNETYDTWAYNQTTDAVNIIRTESNLFSGSSNNFTNKVYVKPSASANSNASLFVGTTSVQTATGYLPQAFMVYGEGRDWNVTAPFMNGFTSEFKHTATDARSGYQNNIWGAILKGFFVGNGSAYYGTGMRAVADYAGTNKIERLTGLEGYSQRTGASGNVTSAIGQFSKVDNSGSIPGVITNAYNFMAAMPYADANNKITNYYAYYVDYINRTGITNRPYGFYQIGTAERNYFAGDTGFGTNNPTEKLHVSGNAKVTQNVSANLYKTESGKVGDTTSLRVVTGVDFLGSVYTSCTLNITGGIVQTDSSC